MNDGARAKEIFNTAEYTCVLCKGEALHTSTKKGVAPLVGWLVSGVNMQGFSAADKIVGKAAALLYVLGGVKEVYASVMSQTAADVLSRHGIHTECDTVVRTIVNRSGTGLCPMEQAVADIDDPAEALAAIQRTMAVLQSREKVMIQ